MAVLMGPVAKIKVCATDGVFVEVGKINTINWEPGRAEANIRSMGDVAEHGAPSDHLFSGSCDGVRDDADAGQTLVMAAASPVTGGHLWVEVLPDGAAGWKAECSIQLKASSASGPEAQKFGFSFKIAGGIAPAAV